MRGTSEDYLVRGRPPQVACVRVRNRWVLSAGRSEACHPEGVCLRATSSDGVSLQATDPEGASLLIPRVRFRADRVHALAVVGARHPSEECLSSGHVLPGRLPGKGANPRTSAFTRACARWHVSEDGCLFPGRCAGVLPRTHAGHPEDSSRGSTLRTDTDLSLSARPRQTSAGHALDPPLHIRGRQSVNCPFRRTHRLIFRSPAPNCQSDGPPRTASA